MLLPGLERAHGQAHVLVAVQGVMPCVAGVLSFRRLPHAFASLRLRVVRTERSRGVGSALLAAALDDARRSRVACVHARADAETEPDAARFLARRGFSHTFRLVTVEGDVDALRTPVALVRKRLEACGRIPRDSRVASLADAPREEMARLYAEHIAHNPELASTLSHPSFRDGGLVDSPVIMNGRQIVGFLLWSLEGAVAHVHARVVSPEHRGRWPNAVLLAEGLARAAHAGATRTRFDIPGGNRDSLKLARRLHADTVRTMDLYRLDLGPANGT